MSNKALVIKPILACNFRCPECSLRRDLHSSIRTKKDRILSLEDWSNFFKNLRTSFDHYNEITISGGEPLLYKDLIPLCTAIDSLGYTITINTNASLIDEAKAKELSSILGLRMLNISIPSIDNNEYIKLRNPFNQKINYVTRAFNAIDNLKKFSNGRLMIIVNIHLQANNYKGFEALYNKCRDHKVDILVVNGLESTFDSSIEDLKMSLQDVKLLVKDLLTMRINIDLHQLKLLIDSFNSPRKKICNIPEEYRFIILANGDVHPCNVIEYSHEVVIGNIFEKSLDKIVEEDCYKNFLKNKSKYCSYCPMNHDLCIPIR